MPITVQPTQKRSGDLLKHGVGHEVGGVDTTMGLNDKRSPKYRQAY